MQGEPFLFYNILSTFCGFGLKHILFFLWKSHLSIKMDSLIKKHNNINLKQTNKHFLMHVCIWRTTSQKFIISQQFIQYIFFLNVSQDGYTKSKRSVCDLTHRIFSTRNFNLLRPKLHPLHSRLINISTSTKKPHFLYLF